MLCEVQEPPRRHRCPISMIMAVDRGCGLRDDKLVENQVLRVISTDLASCWIIVRVLNDHDDCDISDLRPDSLIETAVPGFSSKLALRLIRRWISVRTNSAIRICRFSDGRRDLQHLWAEMGRSGSTASVP